MGSPIEAVYKNTVFSVIVLSEMGQSSKKQINSNPFSVMGLFKIEGSKFE